MVAVVGEDGGSGGCGESCELVARAQLGVRSRGVAARGVCAHGCSKRVAMQVLAISVIVDSLHDLQRALETPSTSDRLRLVVLKLRELREQL